VHRGVWVSVIAGVFSLTGAGGCQNRMPERGEKDHDDTDRRHASLMPVLARSAIGLTRSPGREHVARPVLVKDRAGLAGGVLAPAFEAHRAQLLRYLRARGAGEESEDCLQELWLRAALGNQGAVDDPLAYLYRMAHNLMLDRLRADSRRTRRETAYHSDVHGNGEADKSPTAEDALLARERLRAIERVLAGLGSRTDHIFRRHRIDEIAQRDIAAELGITLSAVEKHLQKAYRAIAAARRAEIPSAGEAQHDPS
jgi:RNA polymerase sigma-70 factor (ECF subfamily)